MCEIQLILQYFFTAVVIIPTAVCQVRFTSTYNNKVTGIVGASVNFTWTFTGKVRSAQLERGRKVLIVIDSALQELVPSSSYSGRISVVWDGSSPGRVTFLISLRSIADEGTYQCTLYPEVLDDTVPSSRVDLVVFVCQMKFTSTYNGNRITGVVGSSVTFNWAFTGSVREVVWKNAKDQSTYEVLVTIYDTKKVILTTKTVYSGRVSGVWNGSSPGQVTFTLTRIRWTDQGLYVCLLSPKKLGANSIYDTVELIAQESPQISLSSVQASYHEGSFVNISCQASGKPEPEVTWNRDGTMISSGKGAALLKFNGVKRTDDGWYLCRANSTAGTVANVTTLVVYYPPTVQNVTTSASKFVIGQTITLRCLSDGIPTPTLTWYKPDKRKINRVRARENIVQVTLRNDQDFGDYKCIAANGLSPSDHRIVKISQIKKPSAPSIVSSEESIQASSLTVRWTEPADDGGSPITGYRVIILKGDTEIDSVTITDPGRTSYTFGGLNRATYYTVKMFARNAMFEGDPFVTTMKTKLEGPPAAVEIYGLSSETTDEEFTLKWKAPEDNGREITQYTVYQRLVSDGKEGEWKVARKITDVSINEWRVKLERDKVYEFTITATNELGESLVDETKVKRVKVVDLHKNNQNAQEECKCSCHDVIYISIVGVLVLVILVLFIYIIWLHKKGTGGRHRVYENEGDYENDMELKDLQLSCPDSSDFSQHPAEYMDIKETSLGDTQPQTAGQVADYAPLHPSTRSWEVSRDHVTIEKIIGKGAFGQVAKGTATDLRGRPGRTMIAIKMLKDDASESDTRDLVNELETMKQLKPHPHVIKLVGCVTETEPLLVLIEYVPFGDLLGYLRKSRGLNDTYFKDPDIKPRTNLTSQQLMKFAWQIADGMSYLSSKSIIHRDLAARNVLVGENETCKVTDFGMARDVQQENVYEKKTKGRLPVKWTAYEALLYGTYTTKSDVWSYGILLYEIFTIGGSPYPRMDGKKIAKLLQQDYRMPKAQHVDDELYQIMMRCWQNDPDVRPAFTELRNQLKDMETKDKGLINMEMYDKQLYANVEDLNV